MEEALMQARRSNPAETWEQRLIQGVLKGTKLLRGVAAAQLAALARQCSSREFKRGATILAKGARFPGVFAVAVGTVKLSLRGLPGEERVIRLVQAGQTFGEPSALLDRPARFEASAITDCKLAVIPAPAIFSLIERDPRCAREIVLALAERSAELLAEIESSSMRGGLQRLAAYLDSLVQPAETNGHCVAHLPASKTVVAARLGMKKETLSRLLRDLAEQRLIEIAQREILILDRVRLAELGSLATP